MAELNRIMPQALSSVFIDKVIKTMHRFVIEDMRLQLEGRRKEVRDGGFVVTDYAA
ncbi:MAG: hypothetical protein HYS18_11990 [Burkholderiales bacterium]|nr:hypothetical protein [Burkholderiales bacterium]